MSLEQQIEILNENLMLVSAHLANLTKVDIPAPVAAVAPAAVAPAAVAPAAVAPAAVAPAAAVPVAAVPVAAVPVAAVPVATVAPVAAVPVATVAPAAAVPVAAVPVAPLSTVAAPFNDVASLTAYAVEAYTSLGPHGAKMQEVLTSMQVPEIKQIPVESYGAFFTAIEALKAQAGVA